MRSYGAFYIPSNVQGSYSSFHKYVPSVSSAQKMLRALNWPRISQLSGDRAEIRTEL